MNLTWDDLREEAVQPHYEAGCGIRPPTRSGLARGVAWEIVPGGGVELWHCEHDHAPGGMTDLTAAQQAEAQQCAADWIAGRIGAGQLADLPVQRDEVT